MGKIYLTQEGYEKLRKDLEYLKAVKRREISKDIERARGHGDLSENAEYDAAKDAQALNEKKIAEIEGKMSDVQIIDNAEISSDEALLFARVTLKDINTNEKIAYTLVSELESDFSQGKISINSPVGIGLLGHKKGEIVHIKVPAGILKYKILKIER